MSLTPDSPKKAGRRPGNEETRSQILAAACHRFAQVGYESTTIRAVAQEAGVDPALVMHYFKNKDGLFSAATEALTEVPGRLADQPSAREFILTYLETWEDPVLGPRVRALARAGIGSEYASEKLRDFFAAQFSHQIQDHPEISDRFPVVGAMIAGVAMSKYLVGVPSTAAMSNQELAELLAPAIESILKPPTP